MCASYGDKRKRGFFESSANKIFTGIREIVPEYAEKRAIWELFQNALDTVEENGIIEIVKTDKGLLFKHNGRPFKDDEFGGLINQFSVGKSYGDNSEKLGQYGTGFISTHVYGKRIFVNGSILTDDGTYRTLKDFELDRTASDIEELTDKLISQDNHIEKLCDDIQLIENDYLPYTSFEYLASEKNRDHIGSMLKYIESILPYIFCFNDKLTKVNLSYDSTILEYLRLDTSETEVTISINGKPIKIPIIKDEKNKVIVILADENRKIDEIPKQFLFYPLMDTTDAGYNFIIHASNFKPNRERDYLHKDNGIDDIKVDVTINENLLKIAFDLVTKKIKEDESISIMDSAKVLFISSDSLFEKELKTNYIENIKDIERIEFDGEKHILSISNLQYLDDSVLSLEECTKKAVYNLLKQFRKIPSYEIYCDLSKYVNNWNKNTDKNLDVLTLTDIAEIVSNESGGNYEYINDLTSYKKFIAQIGTDITLLNKTALVPNIHGDFETIENLVKWENKELLLINIMDSIDASVSKKYIHQDFEFLENISIYNRGKFKEDFSKFCNDLLENLAKDLFSLSDLRYRRLIQTLNNFIGLNNTTPLNNEINTFYNKVFQLPANSNVLSSPTVDVNYQPAIKLLAQLYVRNISMDNIESNINNLKEVLSIMYKNPNLKDELLHKLKCLPNQNLLLKSQVDLKKDNINDEDFKTEYDSIVGGNIRDCLAYKGFEVFLQHSGSINGLEIGEEIEKFLNPDKKFIPVNNGILPTILKLIEKISSKQDTWGQWLRNINSVKEEILMHKFQDESTRHSLFSILSVKPEKINLLGELAKIENLGDLIRAGQEKQKEENRKSTHLSYIKEIGLRIQDIIENKLNSSLRDTIKIIESTSDEKLQSLEEQNGQDFIIYKSDKPIYYIEVKSRWDPDGIVALSKRQVERCAINKEKYAVITVNVANYKSKNKIDFETISFNDLEKEVKVNTDLGEGFENLIKENTKSEKVLENTKLIEFRGHIPQKRIETSSISFEEFIDNLKNYLVNA